VQGQHGRALTLALSRKRERGRMTSPRS
jgi:hypothetical protein